MSLWKKWNCRWAWWKVGRIYGLSFNSIISFGVLLSSGLVLWSWNQEAEMMSHRKILSKKFLKITWKVKILLDCYPQMYGYLWRESDTQWIWFNISGRPRVRVMKRSEKPLVLYVRTKLRPSPDDTFEWRYVPYSPVCGACTYIRNHPIFQGEKSASYIGAPLLVSHSAACTYIRNPKKN